MTEIQTHTQRRNEFYQKFYKEIVPELQEYETQRIQNLVIAIILTILFFLLCTIFLFVAIKNITNDAITSWLMLIALCFGCLAYKTIPYTKKSFENSVKEKIMPLICCCFENLYWTNGEFANYYDDSKLFKASNIIIDYRKCSEEYEDIFEGTYNNVEYKILERLLVINPNFILSRKEHECVLIKLKMNKSFSGNTVVETKRKIKRGGLMSTLSYDYENFLNGSNKRTDLEDSIFNKKYDVYTDDEVEARYLLTSAFMQRLKDLKVAFKADRIRCAFYKDYLLIGLFTTKDLFSICSIFRKIDDTKQFFSLYEEIVSIIKLIDHFKLNQRIGL